MKRNVLVLANNRGRNGDEEFEKKEIGEEVGLFSENLRRCRKEKIFYDLLCMR